MVKDLSGPASAEAAWTNGLVAGTEGAAWLARAIRLAPEDPRIALDLARLRLGGGPEEIAQAAAEFSRVAQHYDAMQIWLGLAIARHQFPARYSRPE